MIQNGGGEIVVEPPGQALSHKKQQSIQNSQLYVRTTLKSILFSLHGHKFGRETSGALEKLFDTQCPLRTHVAILELIDTTMHKLCHRLDLGYYVVGTIQCDFKEMKVNNYLFPLEIDMFIQSHGKRTVNLKHEVTLVTVNSTREQIAVVKCVLVWHSPRIPDQIRELAMGHHGREAAIPKIPDLLPSVSCGPKTNDNYFHIPSPEFSTGHLQFARYPFLYQLAAANVGFSSTNHYTVKYMKEVLPEMKFFHIATKSCAEGLMLGMYADGVLVNQCLMSSGSAAGAGARGTRDNISLKAKL